MSFKIGDTVLVYDATHPYFNTYAELTHYDSITGFWVLTSVTDVTKKCTVDILWLNAHTNLVTSRQPYSTPTPAFKIRDLVEVTAQCQFQYLVGEKGPVMAIISGNGNGHSVSVDLGPKFGYYSAPESDFKLVTPHYTAPTGGYAAHFGVAPVGGLAEWLPFESDPGARKFSLRQGLIACECGAHSVGGKHSSYCPVQS